MKDKQIIAAILLPLTFAMLIIFGAPLIFMFCLYGAYKFSGAMMELILDIDGVKEELVKAKDNLIEVQRIYIKELVKRAEHQQAEIDMLMLEHCPGEMTREQLENWAKHQRAAT